MESLQIIRNEIESRVFTDIESKYGKLIKDSRHKIKSKHDLFSGSIYDEIDNLKKSLSELDMLFSNFVKTYGGSDNTHKRAMIVISIKDFVNTLVDSPQYRKFEQANAIFQKDQKAASALREYQSKAHDLQTKQMFNQTSEEEQKELQRLWINFRSFDSVNDYFTAQANLQAVCRECANIISDHVGLDYAAACGASCCG